MADLQIKIEFYPTRCEICHQFDQFDAEKNYCSRCNLIPKQLNNKPWISKTVIKLLDLFYINKNWSEGKFILFYGVSIPLAVYILFFSGILFYRLTNITLFL